MVSQTVPGSPALAGRRVLVTRAAPQAGVFVDLLRANGAEVIEAPTIAIEPPDTWAPLDASLARLSEFRWVIFTSVNGVSMFDRRLQHHGLAWAALAGANIAAIGPATAAAVRAQRMPVALVPAEYRAEGLVAALRPLLRAGDEVLLPRAAQTRDVLVAELRAVGVTVAEIAAYCTRPTPREANRAREALERREVDVVTFTSSSTVRNFATLFTDAERGRWLDGVTVASIGPITADTAAAFGLTTHIMPTEYTIRALTGAIVSYFSGAIASAPAGEGGPEAEPGQAQSDGKGERRALE